MFAGIHYLAVIVSTLASFVLGFIWYGPVLFGNLWMKLNGKKDEDIDAKSALRGYLVSLVTSFIAVMIMAVLINKLGIHDLMSGLILGAAVGLGFIGLSMWSNNVYEDRPFSLTLIHAGYRFFYFMIVGVILTVWK